MARDVRLCDTADTCHHPGHAGGRAVRVQPAVYRAGRSGRDHRRRPGDAGGRGAYSGVAWAGPALPRALRRLAVAYRARRSRHLDLHQPSGHPHDRAADRADPVADGADHRVLHRVRRPARGAGGLEARHLDRPDGDADLRAGFLGAGIRVWLPARLCVCADSWTGCRCRASPRSAMGSGRSSEG